jgi:hypothetical protein
MPQEYRAMRPLSPCSKFCFVLLVGALSVIQLAGQPVIQTPPRDPVLPAYLRQQAPPSSLSRPPSPPLSPYRLGPVELHPRLSYSHMFSDGLPVGGNERTSSQVRTTAAGISADLGQYWTFDYSPTWVSYDSGKMSDSFDQSFDLSGAKSFQDLSFQLSQSYSDVNTTLVETARQTEQQSWGTHLGVGYNYSPKLKLHISLSVTERSANLTPTVRSWSAQPGLSLQVSPRLTVGLGAGFKYSQIVDATDNYGENFNANVNWRPSDKISISLATGVQSIRSESATGRDLSTPTLDAALAYQPFQTTSVSLGVSRSVSNSYFKDLVTENLRWNLGVQQRLLGRFYLSASYSRSESDYKATNAQGAAGRTDQVEAISTRVSTRLVKRISVSATYQQSKNTSNNADFTFTSDQYGGEVSWSF